MKFVLIGLLIAELVIYLVESFLFDKFKKQAQMNG